MEKKKEQQQSKLKTETPQTAAGESAEEQTAGTRAEMPELHVLTPEEIETLKAEAAKAKEHWEQLLRTAADFDNYKKRTAREKQDLTRYANEKLLQSMLPVLDSFESALASSNSGQDSGADALRTGLSMIQQQFKAALFESGLEEIDALDKPFDPNVHEALTQQERTDVPEGQVVMQTRKGYRLRDRLLRPAAVVVARKPEAPASV